MTSNLLPYYIVHAKKVYVHVGRVCMCDVSYEQETHRDIKAYAQDLSPKNCQRHLVRDQIITGCESAEFPLSSR